MNEKGTKRGPNAISHKLNAEKIKEAADALGETKVTRQQAYLAFGVNPNALDSNEKIKRTETGEIDLDATYQAFATVEEARRRKDEIETNYRLVKYQQLRGELVSKDEVRKAVEEMMISLRNDIAARNRRIAPLLVALTDVRQTVQMLDNAWIEAVEQTRKTWRETA